MSDKARAEFEKYFGAVDDSAAVFRTVTLPVKTLYYRIQWPGPLRKHVARVRRKIRGEESTP